MYSLDDHIVDHAILAVGSSSSSGSVNLDEFFSFTADVLGGLYYVMSTTESADGTVVSPTITSATTTAIFNWITPVGHPALKRLVTGIYDIHAHLKYTKGAGLDRTTTVYCELYKTDAAGGTQVKVGTSSTTVALTTADIFYDLYLTLGTEVTLATSDRLALKWFAVTTGAGGYADTTVTMTVGGTADPHLSISTSGAASLVPVAVRYVVTVTSDLDIPLTGVTLGLFTATLQRDISGTFTTSAETVTFTEISGGEYLVSFTPTATRVVYRLRVQCQSDGTNYDIVTPSEFQGLS